MRSRRCEALVNDVFCLVRTRDILKDFLQGDTRNSVKYIEYIMARFERFRLSFKFDLMGCHLLSRLV